MSDDQRHAAVVLVADERAAIIGDNVQQVWVVPRWLADLIPADRLLGLEVCGRSVMYGAVRDRPLDDIYQSPADPMAPLKYTEYSVLLEPVEGAGLKARVGYDVHRGIWVKAHGHQI